MQPFKLILRQKMKPFDKILLVREVKNLTSNQKNILSVISTHLGKNEFCFLSIDTLLDETCIKKRDCITNNIEELVNLNLITVLPPSNGYKSNRYSINFIAVRSIISEQNKAKDKEKTEQRKIWAQQKKRFRSNKKNKKESECPVTSGDLSSHLGLLVQSPEVTCPVTSGDSKRNLNKSEKKVKDSASLFLPPPILKIQKPKLSEKQDKTMIARALEMSKNDPSKTPSQHMAEIIHLERKA